MEYSKEFLSQFKVDATNYTYVPVDNQPHVVPLIRKGTTKKFEALVYAEESSLRAFQCAAIQYSAALCISKVRICISKGCPLEPISVVCND